MSGSAVLVFAFTPIFRGRPLPKCGEIPTITIRQTIQVFAPGRVMTQAVNSSLMAEPRNKRGSAEAGRLRRSGRIPAVVYGHKVDNEDVSVSHDEFWSILRHNQRIVDIAVTGNKPQKCLVRDVQWDVLGKEVMHIDFERVSADERIHITVPIKLKGSALGLSSGSVLTHHLHELEIECPVGAIPESIIVSVATLQLGQAIHVKDVQLPEGVKALSDPDEVVAAVVALHVPELEATAPAEAGPAEPEVITARKPTEEEGEAEGKKK
jgi:large subunit ribosomal protein L25